MKQENPMTETLDRTKPPKPHDVRRIPFPSYIERKLSNGIPVYIVENHEQPLVSVSLYIRGGSSCDTPELEGLASVVAEMLTKGTIKRTATEISEEIDFVGGSLHANSSWDAITVSLSVLSRFLPVALDLMQDVALHPTFRNEELERLKLQRLAGLMQAKADAGYLADTAFSRSVYEGHSYGLQASGTESSISQITTENLTDFYQTNFGYGNAFVIAAGDIQVPEFIGELDKTFGKWKERGKKVPTPPAMPLQQRQRIIMVEKEGAVQSALRIGHVGIERNNRDFVPVSVVNMLLGGYFNSRINLNLREKNGFTYGARSYFDARIANGPFVVSTEVRTEVSVRAIEEILSELKRIILEDVKDEELEMVKNYVIGNFPLQIETPHQIASKIAAIVLYGLDKDYYDTYRDKVLHLTKSDLAMAARKYVHPDQLSIIVSGNIEVLRGPMREFGEVEIFDANGNALKQTEQMEAV